MASAKPAGDEPLRITPEDVRANDTERQFPGILEHFARAELVTIQR